MVVSAWSKSNVTDLVINTLDSEVYRTIRRADFSGTDEALNQIRSLKIPLADRNKLIFIKLDIRECYLTGSPKEVCRNLYSHVHPPELGQSYKIHLPCLDNHIDRNETNEVAHKVHM